jgi:hypothetical protein
MAVVNREAIELYCTAMAAVDREAIELYCTAMAAVNREAIELYCTAMAAVNREAIELYCTAMAALNREAIEPNVPIGEIEVINSKVLVTTMIRFHVTNSCVSNDHEYVPLVVSTYRSFPHS